MSTGERAYRILKGYISREWDRVRSLERRLAEEELEQIGPPNPPRTAPETELRAGADPRARARRILGVSEDATFRTIHQAFTRLNRRSDPRNFPAGSEEAQIAARLREQVHWAYRVLTEGMDNRELRFGSLELD